MDAANGLRALVLAILAGILLACTDPGANAGSSAASSGAPAGASSAPSEPATDESAAPSGPDDDEY